MNRCALRAVDDPADMHALDRCLAGLGAIERVQRAMELLPPTHVLSSSFGMQAAVMLHLVTRVAPRIPVIFVDTGYHFAETYRFVDTLTRRLSLNLHVARPETSPGWQEARHGKRWELGRDGIDAYNLQNKVAPMRRVLGELDSGTWFSGLRRSQAETRAGLAFVERRWGRFKVHPIADWSDRDVHRYLVGNGLPYHPLREQGYLSIGDWHSTKSIHEVDDEEQLRFFGLVRECGLHGEDPDGQGAS